MRPLLHPSENDISVEGILHALSDPLRAAIFAKIAGSKSAQNCTSFQYLSERGIPKSTLSVHFKALREAGLIRSERHGVEIRNSSRCAELDRRFPGLIASIIGAHQRQASERQANAPEGPPA